MEDKLFDKIEALEQKIKDISVEEIKQEENKIQLLELGDILAKLKLAVFVKSLNQEHEDYIKALSGLDDAMKAAIDADKNIEKVADTIKITAKVVDMIRKALKSTL